MAAATTPISTYNVTLMYGSTPAKLVDIKEFPDIGGEPEMLETTTLSDNARTYILGIQEQEAMTFTANYIKSDFTTIRGLVGTEQDFEIHFGTSGENGKFSFSGYIDVSVNGGGVNEVVDMTITIAPTTPISFA